ncbi:hypothetical protein HanRHA438_Chr17g0812941 [Helianthus annuus]|nr:hypothetical protein HanRHA438_Chr17g0812941 [Helianthus annuus]
MMLVATLAKFFVLEFYWTFLKDQIMLLSLIRQNKLLKHWLGNFIISLFAT